MKKLLSILLALVMVLALTAPAALAAEADPDQSLPLISPKPNFVYDPQQARNEFITSHGGVPGQFNLMINGKFLISPAERPLYQTGGVTYVDAQTLSKALGVEVAADEKGYAAVRPAAEAAGYLCFWDKEFNAGVFISPKALAAEIDKNFTVYNRLLAKNAPAGAAQRSVGSVKADVTVFDSLDGNKTADFSYAYDLTASKAGAAGKVDYDFSALWAALEGYIPMPLDEAGAEEHAKMLELVRSQMKGEAEIRLDLDQQMAYFSMPGLFRALNTELAQSGVQLAENSWLSLSLDGLDLDLDVLAALPDSTPTVGALLCSACTTQSGNGSVRLYDSIMEAADTFAEFLGDKKFTRKGNADVLTLTREDLLALVEEEYGYQTQPLSQFDLTLSVEDNGDAELDFTCRLAPSNGLVSMGDLAVISAKASAKGGRSEATMEYHVRNMFKMTVRYQGTRSAADTAPALTPPKGTAVFDLQKMGALLDKMDIFGA